MNRFGIEVNIKNAPPLDTDFLPIQKYYDAFLETAKKPFSISLERNDRQISTIHTFIHGSKEMREADQYFINRLVKSMLWIKGGYRVYCMGDVSMYEYLKDAYSSTGCQKFDKEFMEGIYHKSFEVICSDMIPESSEKRLALGTYTNGCRIGFDAGGSDRKVSATIDGNEVFSAEMLWNPKNETSLEYHRKGIKESLEAAMVHLPHVDAVGISSAGVIINNRVAASSLFLNVSKEQRKGINDIYIDVVKESLGNIPVVVANDGDVSALAGVMTLGKTDILGIAMGTSEAAGYVDGNCALTGWLNELAFVSIDAQENAPEDEWSKDVGCGAKYFSQDAVIRLAHRVGITFENECTPAEKLKIIQNMAEMGDIRVEEIFTSIGTYLGHTLAYYYDIYRCKNVLVLGRVMSGKGGVLIFEEANRVLKDEYSSIYHQTTVILPNDQFRRLGQSVAASNLPQI